MGSEGIAYISGKYIRLEGLDMPFDRCDLTSDTTYLVDHYSYVSSPNVGSIICKIIKPLDGDRCLVKRVVPNDNLIDRIRKYLINNGVKDNFTGLRFN